MIDDVPMLPHGAREKKAHLWARDEHDFYVEPSWCNDRLFETETFQGDIWDPACGLGRIVVSASQRGFPAVGTDIVKRSEFCSHVIDFLTCDPTMSTDMSIVTNPPFKHAEAFVRRALDLDLRKCAFLLPMAWLNGDKRSRWLEKQPLKRVYVLTPRPSMPPGEVVISGGVVGQGRTDFAWYVFERAWNKAAKIGWLRK